MSMDHRVSRRAFLGAVAGAGVLVVSVPAGASASTRTLYGLNPDWGKGEASCVAGRGGSTCSGCYACVKHAHNKVFATRAAADNGRAHPHCKCVVATLGTVDASTYQLLFGAGTSVDRRTPGINKLIDRKPAQPPTDPTTVPPTDPPTDPTVPSRPAVPSPPPPSRGILAPGSTLPLTGASVITLGAAAAGALVVGSVLLRARRPPVLAAPLDRGPQRGAGVGAPNTDLVVPPD